MSTSWYDAWRAAENNLPMNFGKYIGIKPKKDPGAINAQVVLHRAHRKLRNELGTSSYSPEELKQFGDFLTSIFFEGDLDDNTSVTSKFLKTVIRAYNEVYKEEIQMAEGFSGDITKEKTFSTGQIIKKMKEVEEDKKNVQNRCLNTIHREITEIKKILESITITELKTADIKRKMQKIYDNYDTIVTLYEHQAGNFANAPDASDPSSRWAELKSKMLIRDGLIEDLIELGKIEKGDGLKNTRAGLVKTLNEFETYCLTLKKLALVTAGTYGDVFEFGLALVNRYSDMVEKNVEDWTTKELQAIKKTITGSKTVSRGGGTHLISVDVNSVFDDEFSKYNPENTTNKNLVIFKDGLTEIENLRFSTHGLDGEIKTNEEKQAKMDIEIKVPDEAGNIVKGKTFKVSAKNWNTIDASHDLGFTSFLRGIDRTVGMVSDNQEGLLNYIYVIQHPIDGERIYSGDVLGDPQERRPIAKEALKIGHQLAKESLVLDIAMGLSQRTGGQDFSANILVIMDRKRQRVVVIDLIDEIRKYMDGAKSSFYLEGYDSNEVEDVARSFRSTVRENVSYVGRDRNYVSLMKLYLNSKKASVKLSSNYIKTL